MPDYKVTTDQGTFKVTLDKPPASEAELQSLVEQQLQGQSEPTKGTQAEAPQAQPQPSLAKRGMTAAMESFIPPFMRESPLAKTITDIGSKSVLPTVGMVAGEAVWPPGGGAAGSFLGTAINQILGIEEPSKTQLALSAALPMAGKPVAKGVDWLAKNFAGRDIMSEAAESLLKKWMSPAVSADELYAQARQLTQQVQPSETLNFVKNLFATEKGRIPTQINQQILKAVEPIMKYFQKGQALPAPEMMVELQRLRYLAREAYKAENPNVHLARSLDEIANAMLTDLEKSGSGVVGEAAKAYRKEMALDKVSEILGKPHPLQKFNDLLKDSSLTKGAFAPQEIAQIQRIAKKLDAIPASGGHGVFGKVMTGTVGYESGGMTGLLVGLGGPAVLRKILESPFGRNYAERLLSGSPTVTQEALTALGAFGRGLIAQSPEQAQIQ